MGTGTSVQAAAIFDARRRERAHTEPWDHGQKSKGMLHFVFSSNCFTANLNSSLWKLYLPCKTEKEDRFEINFSVEELARFLIGIRSSEPGSNCEEFYVF